MITLANVIFPAWSAAYLSSLLLPVAGIGALTTECFVFLILQRGALSRVSLIGVVLAINVLSWIVGTALGFLLPTGLVPVLHGHHRIL